MLKMKKITVCDFTLRQLADSGRELLFREKTAIADCLKNIGADVVELPAVVRTKEDAIICKSVASVVGDCVLSINAGVTEKSVDTAWECVKTAKYPRLLIALPVSTAQMEYGFRAKEKAMLELITRLVAYAKTKCDDVEFSALDATRADPDFLLSAVNAAKENGAACITLCDDAGISFPQETAKLVEKVKAACSLPLFVSISDNISMAAASAAAAILAGADGVKTAMTGKNVLLTEKFAAVILAKGAELGAETSLKLTELHRDINDLMKGINSSSASYPTDAAASDAADIFLDATSTPEEIGDAARLLGYEVSDEDIGKIRKALVQVCEHRDSVGSKELEALIASYASQAPSTYHLESFTANCSGSGLSMAQVTLRCGEQVMTGVATGDGPIDSAFRAIEQSIGTHYELDAFQIQAVTEGKEALGSTLVRLRNHGKLYSGTGLSTDIVGSSIRAYVNALNKIVFEENQA